MTDGERERWAEYARDVADRMGLKDWAVEVPGERHHANRNGGAASAWLADGRRVIRIYLPDRFHCDSPEEQRDSIVHELVHAHFQPMNAIVCDWLDDEKQKAYTLMFEYGVDAMTAALAPHMPLPLTLINLETPAMGRQKPKPAETTKPTPPPPKPRPRPKPAT